jgi:hypothetical protein
MMLQQVGSPSTGRNAGAQGFGVEGPACCERVGSPLSGEVRVDSHAKPGNLQESNSFITSAIFTFPKRSKGMAI